MKKWIVIFTFTFAIFCAVFFIQREAVKHYIRTDSIIISIGWELEKQTSVDLTLFTYLDDTGNIVPIPLEKTLRLNANEIYYDDVLVESFDMINNAFSKANAIPIDSVQGVKTNELDAGNILFQDKSHDLYADIYVDVDTYDFNYVVANNNDCIDAFELTVRPGIENIGTILLEAAEHYNNLPGIKRFSTKTTLKDLNLKPYLAGPILLLALSYGNADRVADFYGDGFGIPICIFRALFCTVYFGVLYYAIYKKNKNMQIAWYTLTVIQAVAIASYMVLAFISMIGP